jgi:hypothetical protein
MANFEKDELKKEKAIRRNEDLKRKRQYFN